MNLPTFLVAALVAAVFVLIVYRSIRSHRSGKGACSCGCDGCGGCGCGTAPTPNRARH